MIKKKKCRKFMGRNELNFAFYQSIFEKLNIDLKNWNLIRYEGGKKIERYVRNMKRRGNLNTATNFSKLLQ